jgi:hypothetical protein
MTATSYPLAWPEGFPRAKNREKGKFSTTLSAALTNVQNSLRLFGQDSGKPVTSIVLSSNITLGGLQGDSPGVAVYFSWDGMGVCIPVDRYLSVASNLQAIHHIIEARRVELRHGTLSLVRASFTGFKMLPPPESWESALGFAPGAQPTDEQVATAYRDRAKSAHPDVAGGSDKAMAALNKARDIARKELGYV